MSQLGPIPIPFVSWDEVPNNPFYAPNADIVPELEAYMDQLRATAIRSARIEVVAENLPAGWGEPIYDRLDADIAHVMMGLNAVRACPSAPASTASPSAAPSMATRSRPTAS